jgi:hypothetical protein
MKTRLPVEENCVAIANMSFHDVSDCKFVCDFATVGVLKRNLNGSIPIIALFNFNEVSSWVVVWPVSDQLSKYLYVVTINPIREGKDFCH